MGTGQIRRGSEVYGLKDRCRTPTESGERLTQAKLIYDGDCPFCSRYARYVRLRKAVGDLCLIDARSGGPEVEKAIAQGIDFDKGMLLIIEGRSYHGADCLNRLALMSSRSDFFNRVNFLLFRSPSLSRFCYPLLVAGRNFVLLLLRRSRFGH